MAIANLHETIQASILRRNQLQLEISEFQTQKQLAIHSQTDFQSSLAAGKREVREYFKALFNDDPSLQETYKDYTEIPDFEDEIDRITAEFQDKIDEMASWETAIDAQITTNSTELEEINAYLESYKSMLTSNISEDFNFGLNG